MLSLVRVTLITQIQINYKYNDKFVLTRTTTDTGDKLNIVIFV